MANMDDNDPAALQLWMDQNPEIVSSILGGDIGGQNSVPDTESVNPADLTVNTDNNNNNNNNADYGNYNNHDYSNYNNADYGNTSGFQAPQELVPAVPNLSTNNMPTGPCYHPIIGWYYPATQPANVPPPPPMDPLAGATPAASVPTSAIPSGTSTPIPGPSNAPPSNPVAGPSRPQVKRKYGPGIFGDAGDKGRKSISNEEANYFASSASRREGRGDKKSSFDTSFARRRNRPSIVQACVCQDHAAERIKRPKNAFILFRLSKADEIRKSMGTSFNPDVSKAASQMWNASPKHVKDQFYAMAEAEKQRHAEKYPDYKYKPGGQLRTKFGDKDCTCGAYELNMARFNEKRGIVEGDDAEDSTADDDAYIPSRARAPAATPTAGMQAPPDIDVYSLGLPANQAAQAAAALTTLKRKHNLTVTTGRDDEEPPRKRRSPRATAGTVNYAEPTDDYDDANFDASALFDFDAPCKTPSTGKVEHYNKRKSTNASASPVKHTRSNKQATRAPSIITIKSEDSDSDGDTIVVAPRKPSPAKQKKSSTSTQGSGRSGVSTRSQTGRRRSLRSGGL